MSDTIACPFCAEEIKAAARKCKHCGEFVDGSSPSKPATVAASPQPASPPAHAIEKQVYQDDGGILITTARIMLSGKVFATANVTSVSIRESVNVPPKGGAIATAVVGGLIALGGLNGSIPALIVGGILIAGGVLWYNGLKDVHRFHVFIGSASGESEGLSHSNRKYIAEVAQAINQAIALRG